MADVLDDQLIIERMLDFSAGQWSYHHPADKITIPVNAGVLITNAEIDIIGKLRKRRGYVMVADDVGSAVISGLAGFFPAGGTRLLIMEANGVIYSWNGTDAAWTSRETGKTAATQTDFVVANDGIYRLGQTDAVEHSTNGTSWTQLTDTNADFPKALFGIFSAIQRVFVFNTSAAKNAGYWADAGTAANGAWDRTTDLQRFGPDDDRGVTGAIEFTKGEIIVFTQSQMFQWTVSDASPSNWQSLKIADIGCVGFRTVVQIGEDILFLAKDGVRSVVQSAQDQKRGASLPISAPIQDLINDINWNKAHLACAWAWNDKYFLSVPLTGSDTNNLTLVWSRRAFEANQGRGGWLTWTGLAPGVFATQDFAGLPKLYFGEATADSKVYLLRNSNPDSDPTNDNGTAIALTLETKRIDNTLPEVDKTFQTAEVTIVAKDAGEVVVEAQLDGAGYTEIGRFSQTEGLPTLPIVLPFVLKGANFVKKKYDLEQLGQGRDCQLKITESTLDADCEIISLMVSSFVEEFDFNED